MSWPYKFVELAVVLKRLVVVAEVDVEFTAVKFCNVEELLDNRCRTFRMLLELSQTKFVVPPERRAGVPLVEVQKGTKVAVSCEEVDTVPAPLLPVEHGLAILVTRPPVPACRQLPGVRDDTESAVVEAYGKIDGFAVEVATKWSPFTVALQAL